MVCAEIMPPDRHLPNGDEPIQCLLERGHAADHLGKLQNGLFVRWILVKDGCDCGEEDCRCCIYERLPPKDGLAILEANQRNPA